MGHILYEAVSNAVEIEHRRSLLLMRSKPTANFEGWNGSKGGIGEISTRCVGRYHSDRHERCTAIFAKNNGKIYLKGASALAEGGALGSGNLELWSQRFDRMYSAVASTNVVRSSAASSSLDSDAVIVILRLSVALIRATPYSARGRIMGARKSTDRFAVNPGHRPAATKSSPHISSTSSDEQPPWMMPGFPLMAFWQ